MRAVGLVSGLALFLAASAPSGAQDARLPHVSFASVDWPAAIATLPNVDKQPAAMLSARARRAGVTRAASPRLAQLNNVMSQVFAGLPTSPVPVLMPFDVAGLMQDQALGVEGPEEGYFSGFHAARFFYPGPAGYDAAFAVRGGDMPELADWKSPQPVVVQISGSALLYDLDAPVVAEGQPVAALEAEFPGIRRTILEHHLRYTFVRFGVPYVVSVLCFDSSVSRYRMPTCRSADQVAQRFLSALRVVGGMPRTLRPSNPLPVERPQQVSRNFGYFAPGQLISGSGGGRADYTAYSQIRFPLEDAPAFAISQVYARRDRIRFPDSDETGTPSAVWHDNFCERRSFPVAQCPSGFGHQGQDIRPAPCKPPAGADRCVHRGNIVAVRDGVILRSPRQEAAYLIVNSANEHIRFRYLHMNPRKMDAEGLLNGRRVHEGEIIGEVSNFSMREAGTSYHLHFDIQVPTRQGWVFVNPYMTLVTAYERLIGERGTELFDPGAVASAEPFGGGTATMTAAWCFTNPASCRKPVLATVAAARLEPDPLPGVKEASTHHDKAETKSHRLKIKSASRSSRKSAKSSSRSSGRSGRSRHRQRIAHR